MDHEEEEDVMGLLFAANASDDDFVPPSGMGKGKGKSRAVVMDSVVHSPESVGASSSTRVQRKRRPKAFPDETETEYRVKDDDDDHESNEADSGARAISAPAPPLLDARPKKRRRTTTTTSSSSLAWTFCYHCRCKSRRPKMRCSVIVASAGERCRKLYCDGCIEKRYSPAIPSPQTLRLIWPRRYPQLAFDLFADTFACPACSGYCNCSLCAPKRGEKYVPERDGGWRSWIAKQGGGTYLATVPAPPRAFTTKTKGSKNKTPAPVKATPAPAPAKKRAPKTTTTPTAATANAPVFDSGWSATPVITVSGEPLGNEFLHDNTAHVVPVQQQPMTPPPPPAPPSATSTPETAQGAGPSSVPSGSRARPTRAESDKGEGDRAKGPQQHQQGVWHFVGSLEPLLLARRQKHERRRRSASLDANVDNPGEYGEEDEDADADRDTDDGHGDEFWPGVFVVPTIVVTEQDAEPKMEMVGTRITPEEVERAIGAAFAIGTAV